MEKQTIFAENNEDMNYPIGIQTFKDIRTADFAYVDNTAEEALQQIEDKQYAAPFATDPRKLFKIGVCFSSEERGISAWCVKERA